MLERRWGPPKFRFWQINNYEHLDRFWWWSLSQSVMISIRWESQRALDSGFLRVREKPAQKRPTTKGNRPSGFAFPVVLMLSLLQPLQSAPINPHLTRTAQCTFPVHMLTCAPGPRRLVSKPPMLRSGVAVKLTQYLDFAESQAREMPVHLFNPWCEKALLDRKCVVMQKTVLSTTRFPKAVGSGVPTPVRPSFISRANFAEFFAESRAEKAPNRPFCSSVLL